MPKFTREELRDDRAVAINYLIEKHGDVEISEGELNAIYTGEYSR